MNKHKFDRVSVQSIKAADTSAIDSSEFPIFEVEENAPSHQPKTEPNIEEEK